LQDRIENTEQSLAIYNSLGENVANADNGPKYVPVHKYIESLFLNKLIQPQFIEHFHNLGYDFDKIIDVYTRGYTIKNLQMSSQKDYYVSVLSFYPPLNVNPVGFTDFHKLFGKGKTNTTKWFYFNVFSRYICILYHNNKFCLSNLATLVIYFTRRADDVLLLSDYLGTNVIRKNNDELSNEYMQNFYSIFSVTFNQCVSCAMQYFYQEEHTNSVMGQVFFFTTTQMKTRSYSKTTFVLDQNAFSVVGEFNSVFGANHARNTPVYSFDGYTSNAGYQAVLGNNHLAEPFNPFSFVSTLDAEKQDIFFRFIGSLMWFWSNYNLNAAHEKRMTFLYMWTTLLYREEFNLEKKYNYHTLMYDLNRCITNKIFYISLISNNQSKFFPASRELSFHVVAPYKDARYELTGSFLSDFYPFVSFFSKLHNKSDELNKLTDYGRSLLARFLNSLPIKYSNIFIPRVA